MNDWPLISLLTLIPIAGGILVSILGASGKRETCWIAGASTVVTLLLALYVTAAFDQTAASLQFVERQEWIPSIGVDYFVGLDGLGILMVLLTAIVTPMALFVSRFAGEKNHLFYALILFLQGGLFGVFTALNFFHWFLYWELSLIPAFFLVKLWGGERRGPAATQFFIYTMVGSVAMLISFLAIYMTTGVFDFIRLAELGGTGEWSEKLSAQFGSNAETVSLLIFLGIFLGFAVKIPLMPFHTWLPSTYAEAPSSVTMLLTGLMSKMGVYGVLRILLPIFPEQMRTCAQPLLWLAAATIVFSAYAALVQKDIKRILAYSSINHLGYCLLAIFAVASAGSEDGPMIAEKAAAVNGVLFQMFSHGLTAATLFGFVAFLEARSGGMRGVDDFGGLRKAAPAFCALMSVSLFASLGLPGLNGFVGEFLIFRGAFPLAAPQAAVSALGLLITAVFILGIIQRVFNGPVNERWKSLPDLNRSERWIVIPPTLLMVILGVYPRLLIDLTNSTVMKLVEQL